MNRDHIVRPEGPTEAMPPIAGLAPRWRDGATAEDGDIAVHQAYRRYRNKKARISFAESTKLHSPLPAHNKAEEPQEAAHGKATVRPICFEPRMLEDPIGAVDESALFCSLNTELNTASEQSSDSVVRGIERLFVDKAKPPSPGACDEDLVPFRRRHVVDQEG
mmetsp:Transcript_46785/g.117217  ORF Transcript_46785/g.117217 Transcript_46785/m.117217 type:complete len:163 (+) Transcript_46785:79-567(+)|eukprot:CAMPEP_0173439648 /NCGR_PEP_ID=MMETSP1357-20121228/21323_1 /TAXON_ID=77926 /ORGANISM="Hemiselmis rufescens, Strain PCC563" /LENGTH=162 /DNA_ID=CAMNT_0014405039 /DNA_START=72 /DNA_END=560 /DNA_ORIENTATION=+